MSLHSGLDLVSIASHGNYTETYGVGEEGNIANLGASFGLLEDAPATGLVEYLKSLFFGGFF